MSAPDRVAYGDDPDQFGEWWMPGGAGAQVGTALLLHGGYYRSPYTLDLTTPMAADLAARGWAVWNVEYRRPDAHDWSATQADIHGALAALGTIASYEAEGPLVAIGHSAGGQLALQLAEETAAASVPDQPAPAVPRIDLAVSLAGVVDLADSYRRRSSNRAVSMALGGSPRKQAARYAAASPSFWPQRRVPWLLVQGADDGPEFVLPNRALSANARLDHPELLELPGDHFAVIDPAAPIWAATVARITELLAPARPAGS